MNIDEITLATQNAGKAYEITLALGDLPVRLVTMKDKGITVQDPEHGKTLIANAQAKADHVQKLVGGWVLSDDSGIFFGGLSDKAGVTTKEWIDGREDPVIFERFLRAEFAKVRNYFATFTAVVVLLEPDGTMHGFDHRVPGDIVLAGRGRVIPNLPLCRHFVPHGQHKTLAEMSTEQFRQYSHRSIALRNARAFLESYLERDSITM